MPMAPEKLPTAPKPGEEKTPMTRKSRAGTMPMAREKLPMAPKPGEGKMPMARDTLVRRTCRLSGNRAIELE
jgi:hypothetical protein